MTRFKITRSAVIVLATLAATQASVVLPTAAQTVHGADPDSDSIAAAYRGVAAIGRQWDTAAFIETARLYTTAQREVEWPGVRAAETISYGTDPLQTLRLFLPEQGFSEPGPVFVFVHGNGLGDSDQIVSASEELIYSNVGKLGARFGGIGITVNYRQAGTTPQRSGAEDIAAVITWIAEHISSYGGDPNTVVLLANSEGAGNAAIYLFDGSLHSAQGSGLAAAILSSGTFGDSVPLVSKLIEDYDGPRTPLALWTAQYDPAPVEIAIAEVFTSVCRKYQGCPTLAQLPGHNHVSHVMSLGTDDLSVLTEMLRFYHTVR